MRMPHRSWRAAGAALWLLAACAAPPPTRFHSLLATEPPARAAATPGVSWELADVNIPAQVDRPQMVLRLADDSLAVLEQDRWIAPLRDELRAALAERLASRLGPPGADATAASGDATPWRIDVEVLRFDSMPAAQARIVADWTLRRARSTVSCRSSIEQAAGGGLPGLVQAHQEAVLRLADEIAAVVGKTADGQAPRCAA